MQTVRDKQSLRAVLAPWRAAGQTVGLVPTMGALHAGHLSLLQAARRHCDRIVTSIFINPKQFGPNEDVDRYPRDLAADAAMLRDAGCDLLYAPGPKTIYPPGFATEVRVSGVSDGLCGPVRPGHFAGVATVVTKLLLQVGCDAACFGEKDFQQLAVIRRMVEDLDIPTAVIGCPTLRDPDGLAMSSRNRYLSPAERARAVRFAAELVQLAGMLGDGAPVEATLAAARDRLVEAVADRIDYLELADADSLTPWHGGSPPRALRLLAALWIGNTRLIDNLPVEIPRRG
jgi:pantoate--beta-alanine ligase